LGKDDFRRILTETEASLIKQYVALMATEDLTLEFTEDAIDALAEVAVHLNSEYREYRRPAAADRNGTGSGRNFFHRAGPAGLDNHD
jgi:hypothetical protein